MDDGSTGGEGTVAAPPGRRYKGVRLRKWGRWVSEIRMPNSRERIWLGSYESAEKAARAFDAAAVCLRCSRAGSLHFPESPPDVPYSGGRPLSPEQIQAEAARQASRARPAVATAAAARASNHDTAVAMPSTGDDVLDWSFMDALPSQRAASTTCGYVGLLPAMDDFMCEFLHPVAPPSEKAAEDENDGDAAEFCSVLWSF